MSIEIDFRAWHDMETDKKSMKKASKWIHKEIDKILSEMQKTGRIRVEQ